MKPKNSSTAQTNSAQETQNCAKQWAENAKKMPRSPRLWFLKGDCGAGKSTFVKGFAESEKIPSHEIQSPSFGLRRAHGNLIHYDLYRLTQTDWELLEQIEEELDQGKIVLIEWAERFPELNAHSHWEVKISGINETRELSLLLVELQQ